MDVYMEHLVQYKLNSNQVIDSMVALMLGYELQGDNVQSILAAAGIKNDMVNMQNEYEMTNETPVLDFLLVVAHIGTVHKLGLKLTNCLRLEKYLLSVYLKCKSSGFKGEAKGW